MAEYKIQQADVDLLRKAGVPEDDIEHSVKVAEKALETIPKYGKNDKTLDRYLNYHREIQTLLDH